MTETLNWSRLGLVYKRAHAHARTHAHTQILTILRYKAGVCDCSCLMYSGQVAGGGWRSPRCAIHQHSTSVSPLSLFLMLHSSFFPISLLTSFLRFCPSPQTASVSVLFFPFCLFLVLLRRLLILFTLFLNGLSVEGGEEVENTREREMERKRGERAFTAKYRAGLNNLLWPGAISQSLP